MRLPPPSITTTEGQYNRKSLKEAKTFPNDISEFYERYQLKKYNFDPEYQRRGDVWSEDKQSFLIDSIIKNYPMPPIFLHQVINSDSGATEYNVIDGKQRLTAILSFINNEISLPSDYDVGAFGDSRLNGKKFSDLDGDLQDFKMQFWKYVISVEYIESGDLDVINNVFDRLNRNGEPLEPQELRKAKYYNTELMNLVDRLTEVVNWKQLGKVKINRMQDSEFVSELVFFLLENEPMDASKKENIDDYYQKWSMLLTSEKSQEIEQIFKRTIEYINELSIDFERFKINGVSHFYALFALAYTCIQLKANTIAISDKLNSFFASLRNSDAYSEEVSEYKESMQANTRSKGQRVRRIHALTKYCGLND